MKRQILLLAVFLNLAYWLLMQPWYLFIVSTKAPLSYTGSLTTAAALLSPLVFYVAYFFLFASLKIRHYRKFAWQVLLSLMVFIAIGYAIFKWNNPGQIDSVTMITLLVYLSLRIISTALIAFMLKGFINWFGEQKYKEQLEKQNLEANLALLKAQINPHFLFNTLNNIDVLIEKDQTTASAYLKKLSDILRFTLYETPSETIPLSREVDYINQYIDLQKIRTSNPDFVNFEVKIDNPDLQIAPMLFIPFIENAFKHSTNKKINNAIQISVSTSGNSVTFNCSNAYDAEAIKTQEQSGLGLELIKSRLQLLYQDKYRLDFNKTSDRFTVDLSITPTP